MKIKNIPLCLAFSSTLINASQLNLFDLLSKSDENSLDAAETQTLKKDPRNKMQPVETRLSSETPTQD